VVRLGFDWQGWQTYAALGGDVPRLLAIGVRRCLIVASNTITMGLANGKGGLKGRSGRLSKAWAMSPGDSMSGVNFKIDSAGERAVGVLGAGSLTTPLKYAAIHNFGGTVRPQGHPFLAIPVGPNVLPSGAVRASQASPRDIPGIVFIKRDADTVLGMTKDGPAPPGGKAPMTLWFVLKRQVFVPARHYLDDAMKQAGDAAPGVFSMLVMQAIQRRREMAKAS
jgi:hypothetical protein